MARSFISLQKYDSTEMKLFFNLICCFLFVSSTMGQSIDQIKTRSKENTSSRSTQADPNYQYQLKSNSEPQKEVETDSLQVEIDDRIELLCQNYFASKKISGYRVQIFSGNSRWEASKVKSDFISKFKDAEPPILVYQPPNFKLRVGNFRDRLKAQKHLNLYKEAFPSAFLVKDEIEVSFKD